MLLPRQPVAHLGVPIVGGGQWSLAEQHPDRFSLVVFYRGHHYPVCRGPLKRLDMLLERLAEVCVILVIAVIGDDGAAATASRAKGA